MATVALTYSQLDALTTNDSFLGRVRNSCRHYANYLLNLQGATQQQLGWVNSVFFQQRAAQIAANMAGQLVQDAAITSAANVDASDVTDAALESAVEKICLSYN